MFLLTLKLFVKCYSARSRVRGHLIIYHAYLNDSSIPVGIDDNSEQEHGWELVDHAPLNSVQVSYFINFTYIYKRSSQ